MVIVIVLSCTGCVNSSYMYIESTNAAIVSHVGQAAVTRHASKTCDGNTAAVYARYSTETSTGRSSRYRVDVQSECH